MTNDLKTSFLTYYIRSLAERTRVEKSGTKLGFDWIVYNLALAADLAPHRLPFLRGGSDEFSKTKTEPEFGIDLSFLSTDRQKLIIFVLKDEVLNNSNWGKHDIDTDLRKAAAPDLRSSEVRNVEEVCVILAYNKDENQAGIELFDRLAASLGTKVGDSATLSFERWNLTRIVELVRDTLLTPSLLPQKFFSHFSYLCSQFGDFRHGSDEWTRQLVPNWRRFLDELLAENADERSVRLLPVALIVLREHGRPNPTAETGWIDLVEWGMLAAWQIRQSTTKKAVRQAVDEMWCRMYLAELERYYRAQAPNLAVEFSLDKHLSGSSVDAIASAIVALWHVARLGVLAVAYSEVLASDTEQQETKKSAALNMVADWLIGLLNASPSAKRPFLDIHHIELFLIWRSLRQVGRSEEIFHWLLDLQLRLFARRAGQARLPFIDGHNSLETVFEYAATNERPHEFCDKSSTFLMCLMELCFSLPQGARHQLLDLIYRRLVQGNADCGKRMDGCEPIDLMLWHPPMDWGERILSKSLGDEGECITVSLDELSLAAPHDGADLANRVGEFVKESRRQRPFHVPDGFVPSIVVLACLKHQSPLPPELWRLPIFGPADQDGESRP